MYNRLIKIGLCSMFVVAALDAGSVAARFMRSFARLKSGLRGPVGLRVKRSSGMFFAAGVGLGGVQRLNGDSATKKRVQGGDKESSYSELRARFESNLLRRQGGLMAPEEYARFVAPHLNKAEGALAIVGHLKQEGNIPEAMRNNYFDMLLDYNVAWFIHYVNPSKDTQEYLLIERAWLEALIKTIAQSRCIDGLSAETEMQKTTTLIEEINKDFYTKLPWYKKLYLKYMQR